jgi:glycosyltransferase involved in cell wall biosynthesis
MFASNKGSLTHTRGDILFITHDLSLSGAPMVLNTLAVAVASNGFYPTVISPKDGKLLDYYRQKDIPVLIDPLTLEYPKAIKNFFNDFDVVVANTILSWPAVITAKELGKPVIWFVYESAFGEDLAQRIPEVRIALSRTDIVIFPSEQIAGLYRKFTGGKNFQILLFSADTPTNIGRENIKTQIPATSAENLQVVHIGSIEYRKGQDVLVQSILDELKDVQNSFDFHFIGRVLSEDYYK